MRTPRITALLAALAATASLATAQVVEVPLRAWTSAEFPQGLVFGATRGVSIADYDRDGWVDVFAASSGRLWRNLGGKSWRLAADLDEGTSAVLSNGFRYGSSFGDYDNDGLPDLAIEPRVWPGFPADFELLHNLGGAQFAQVASTAATIISAPGTMDAETICWGDVDGDGDIDLFVPAYPAWANLRGKTDNVFWTNLGPTGPGNAYRFAETTAATGLLATIGSTRPEGAQLCDLDGDGDLDLYSNGTLYQNRSTRGVPAFIALSEAATGIGLRGEIDEGAVLCDYDLDGDFDLFVSYWATGLVLWDNRGDGSFVRDNTVVQAPTLGLQLGISAADWDNDGDIDLTMREVFRRNQLIETGQRQFTVATHGIFWQYITSATPAWADWDRDGDLDCVLGNWGELGRFYENTTYNAQTPLALRRHVRVRPLRDAAAVPAGLENEFGAVAEVRFAGATRRQFASSASGYLNQNEYALHFALPPDPTPAQPATDLRFTASVQFPGIAGSGLRRIDARINPALDLDLADLSNRQIDVFRSGRVVLNGCAIAPTPMEDPVAWTTAGGLATPQTNTALPGVRPAPGAGWFVGLAFDTSPAKGLVRVTELLLDGQLDQGFSTASGSANVVLWDITDPLPVVFAQQLASSSPRNDRHAIAVDWVLPAGRQFRVVVQVTDYRATTFQGPSIDGPLRATGGLLYADAQPTNGATAAHANLDPTNLYLALRARPAQADVFSDLGNAAAGSGTPPQLLGTGTAQAGAPITLALSGAAPGAPLALVFGQQLACRRLGAGALLPKLTGLLPLAADASGAVSVSANWPANVAPGDTLLVQAVVADATAPQGLALSNCLWMLAR